MLKDRIKSLIALIKNTEIEEIEVSSFWGAQKIRLSKKKTNKNIDSELITEDMSSVNIDLDKDLSKNIDKPDITTGADDGINSVSKEKDNKIELESELEIDKKSIDGSDFYELKAPLVGTFYSSPKPSDPPFVNVGDKITKGQVVCIIEAMKIFNDIESEVTGTVHEMCIENGSPIEYDQVIIKILPE